MDYASLMTKTLEEHKLPLRNDKDLDALIESIGDRRFVLLGEASHGTHDFYTWRAHLTKRLIEEKGFDFVAVEGDWPDCYEINRYIKGLKDAAKSPSEIIHHFKRWPTFMYANWEIAALAGWMRQHNLKRPLKDRVGFYGLDVYSLLESLEATVEYLKKVDGEEAVKTAEKALACFERVAVMGKEDIGQAYGMAAALTPYSCRSEVVDLLATIRKEKAKLAANPKHDEEDEEANLSAEINAKVALDAEKYYRIMVDGSEDSWNARDAHFQDTLTRVANFYGPESKGIVWAHNTHNGDARATDMASAGLYNIGQLAREQWGKGEVYIVGFGTYQGTVMAGKRWGAPMEEMPLPPGRPGTWEDICHRAGKGQNMLLLPEVLQDPIFEKRVGHRAVGVVYHPHRDIGNYVPSVMKNRYDAFMFLDTTKAVHALKDVQVDMHEMPETYPWGV